MRGAHARHGRTRLTRRGRIVVGAGLAVALAGGVFTAQIVSRTSPPTAAAAAEVARTPAAPTASPSDAARADATRGAHRHAREERAGRAGVYAGITSDRLSRRVRRDPVRVYVPNNHSNTVDVIDPRTYRVVRRIAVGQGPQHVTPAWNMRYLYVGDTYGNALTVIDPRRSRVLRTIRIPDPYNLYFTPDGSAAIDVAERLATLYFYDPRTWKLLGSVHIPWAGPDHLDFSADGRFLLISTEFDGHVVKVDTHRMKVVASLAVGGLPVDVKLAPNGSSFYVANQGRGGVSVIDPRRMRETDFIHTGAGAHGLCVSRDARFLYVSNRLAGTISVVSFASNRVVHTWRVGESPDMLQVSADGRELWASNRYDASVSVIRTRTGRVIHTIPVGESPHGLTLFPQPGRFSLGHNGVYR